MALLFTILSWVALVSSAAMLAFLLIKDKARITNPYVIICIITIIVALRFIL